MTIISVKTVKLGNLHLDLTDCASLSFSNLADLFPIELFVKLLSLRINKIFIALLKKFFRENIPLDFKLETPF